jgi:hypothetical protein
VRPAAVIRECRRMVRSHESGDRCHARESVSCTRPASRQNASGSASHAPSASSLQLRSGCGSPAFRDSSRNSASGADLTPTRTSSSTARSSARPRRGAVRMATSRSSTDRRPRCTTSATSARTSFRHAMRAQAATTASATRSTGNPPTLIGSSGRDVRRTDIQATGAGRLACGTTMSTMSPGGTDRRPSSRHAELPSTTASGPPCTSAATMRWSSNEPTGKTWYTPGSSVCHRPEATACSIARRDTPPRSNCARLRTPRWRRAMTRAAGGNVGTHVTMRPGLRRRHHRRRRCGRPGGLWTPPPRAGALCYGFLRPLFGKNSGRNRRSMTRSFIGMIALSVMWMSSGHTSLQHFVMLQ